MRPACQVFINGASDADVRSLIRTLSAQVKKSGKADLKAFIFFIDGDKAKIEKLNKEEKADNIALGILASKDEGMKLYKINPKAQSTVLLYKKRIVTSKMVDYSAKNNEKELKAQLEALTTK